MIERESMFLLGPWSFAWSLSFPSCLDYVAGCCLPIPLALCATEMAFSLLVLDLTLLGCLRVPLFLSLLSILGLESVFPYNL